MARQSRYIPLTANMAAVTLGPAGAIGDLLTGIVLTPSSTAPGAVSISDGATTIVLFAGGAGSVSSLRPIVLPFGQRAVLGPWKITTGANYSGGYAVGEFS